MARLEIKKPITLVGMMGCGKTTVGKALSDELSLPFYDLDKKIEKMVGVSIKKIFTYQGENFFREKECEALNILLEKTQSVIAVGGGAFILPTTHKAILQKGLSIWLNAPGDILWERVRKNKDRPLANNKNKDDFIALLNERKPLYKKADIIIDIDAHEKKAKTVEKIITAIQTLHND